MLDAGIMSSVALLDLLHGGHTEGALNRSCTAPVYRVDDTSCESTAWEAEFQSLDIVSSGRSVRVIGNG